MLQSKKAPEPISDIEHYERRISLFLQELHALGIHVELDQNGHYQTNFNPSQFHHREERLATMLKIKILNNLRDKIRKVSENG